MHPVAAIRAVVLQIFEIYLSIQKKQKSNNFVTLHVPNIGEGQTSDKVDLIELGKHIIENLLSKNLTQESASVIAKSILTLISIANTRQLSEIDQLFNEMKSASLYNVAGASLENATLRVNTLYDYHLTS